MSPLRRHRLLQIPFIVILKAKNKGCQASTFVLKSGLKIWFEGAIKDYISEEGLTMKLNISSKPIIDQPT